ncbi:dihydrodipicolinate synthase family protein [Cellvibrio polysaccharolyticus]|uniref:Dihydrodipicolinate synthase family protein n=1 Tax=Cellvibrio polysaccharolyticus TaxID=2082724 RepID=A0A928YUP8_9GAMM|nr:dihydrodipicolinate synthase family protein [Cellvibrio polysaccharolyticus]MBE8718212.1 dihydrodipicolinate synthase family protein [Cellvibrio polysaccharolyticus]
MSKDINAAFAGISGVHVTPYDQRGEIDEKLLRTIVDRIAAAGIHNIVTGGNTGEFYAQDLDEVTRVYELAVEANAGRSCVTAGIGRSAREAIKLAAAAKKAGVDALMIHQPVDPFCSARLVVDYVRQIADSTDLPIIAYARSPLLLPEHFARMAEIPNVIGVKYAVPDPIRLAESIRATKGQAFQWICGLAESWALPFYACGARGFTSGLVNVNPELSLRFYRALEEGDQNKARALVDAIADFEIMRTYEANGANVTVVKEALVQMGFPVGPVRAPGVVALNAAQREKLALLLNEWRQLSLE